MASSGTRLNATTEINWTKTKSEIEAYLYSRQTENVLVVKDDDHHRVLVAFRLFGRIIQMEQKLVTLDSSVIKKGIVTNGSGHLKPPSSSQAENRLLRETNRRWRVMFLRVKLRLDMIFDEEDLEEREAMFKREFLPDTVVPGGGTVREFMEPQVAEAYRTGKAPALLPGPGSFRLLETTSD